MRPRITVITIGVDDLDKALRFYRDGLGLPTDGIVGEEFEYGAVVFIDLQAGVRLALWPRTSIARDTGLGLVGHIGPLRRAFMRQAAGLTQTARLLSGQSL